MGKPTTRMCMIFDCVRRNGNPCCADCGFNRNNNCKNPCLNHPDKCGYVLVPCLLYTSDAVSEGGDQGLFQINPVNNDWLQETLGLDDVMEPMQNMEAGVYMLSLFDYEDPHKRLMAYNCGIGRAKELWESGVTRTSYSEEVTERMKEYGKEI